MKRVLAILALFAILGTYRPSRCGAGVLKRGRIGCVKEIYFDFDTVCGIGGNWVWGFLVEVAGGESEG